MLSLLSIHKSFIIILLFLFHRFSAGYKGKGHVALSSLVLNHSHIKGGSGRQHLHSLCATDTTIGGAGAASKSNVIDGKGTAALIRAELKEIVSEMRESTGKFIRRFTIQYI